MKKILGLGAVVLCGAGFVQLACSSGADSAHSVEPAAGPKMDDLIGSIAVNSASLDGIGSIGFVYDYSYPGPNGGSGGQAAVLITGGAGSIAPPLDTAGTPGSAGIGQTGGFAGTCGIGCGVQFEPLCTGTLVSKNSVLTSRSCGAFFEQIRNSYAASLKFAIGANSASPKRLIEVVDVEYAPVVSQDSSPVYPDLAVLHLAESVSDVAAFPVAPLGNDLIGKQVAAVGYGYSDLRYASGTRRAGAITVRATSGLLYPAIFGSFEAFYSYVLGGVGYGAAGSGVGGFASLPLASGSLPPLPNGGFGGSNASAGAGGWAAGTGGASAGMGGGGPNDWYRQHLQQQYDTVSLLPGEAYLGGTDDDTQPCGADQGGPVVRKLQGQVRVLGVFSHKPFLPCEKGAIYTAITSSTKSFIDSAAQWKDPCTNTTQNGKCVGNVATRCSTPAEGKRRLVKLDCSLLNQVCVASSNAEVTCSDK